MKYVIKNTLKHEEKILSVSVKDSGICIVGTSCELTYYNISDMSKTVLCRKSKSIRAVTQNKNIIACASYDGTGVIFKDMIYFDNIEGPETEVKGIALNEDNEYLAISTRGKQVWILKIIDDFIEIESVINDHTQDVKGVIFNDTRLFSFGYDCTIKMYERSFNDDGEFKMIQNITNHSNTIWEVSFCTNYMISCDDGGFIFIYILDDNGFYKFYRSEKVSNYPIYSLICIYEKYIVFVVNRFNIIVIDFKFNPVLFIDGIHNYEINCIDWCKKNNHLVSGDDDGKINIIQILE